MLASLTTVLALNTSILGSLPSEMGRSVVNLQYIATDSSNIYGAIPSELGQATRLVQILMPSNLHSGSIPSTLGKLINLGMLTYVPLLRHYHFYLQFPNIHYTVSSRRLATRWKCFDRSELLLLTNLDTLQLYQYSNSNLTGPFTCPDFIEVCEVSCRFLPECRVLE